MVIHMRGSSNWYAVKKTVCSVCHTTSKTYYDSEIKRARDLSSGSFRIYVEFEYRRVFCKKHNAVKVETLSWLASNTRFAEMVEAKVLPCKRTKSQESCHRHRKDFYVLHEGGGVYPF